MSATHNLSTIKRHIKLSDIIGQTLPIKKQSNDQYLGKCPFHSDNTPSFRIYDDTGKYYCFGCQAGGDVFDWLQKQRGMNMTEAKDYLGVSGLEGIKPVEKKVPRLIPIMPIPAEAPECIFPYSPEMIHHYHNEEGELMFHIARYAARAGKKKWFLPMFLSQDMTWQSDNIMPQDSRPIYGLEKLKKITGVRIAVAGEKKCDKLQSRLIENATISWSGGDGAFDKSNWLPVKDDVIIYWPDNDPKSIDVQHKLAKVCKKLYVIPIPEGKPINWDCSDAIDEGWTNEQIMALIATKILYEAPLIEVTQELTVNGEEEVTENYIDDIFPLHLLSAPGLIGMIVREILNTSIYPRPVLALAAAIAACGVIMGHNVRSESDLRTNLYILGMALSGAGKNYPRIFIKKLFLKAGIRDCISGPPVSGAAVLTAASKNHGKGIIFWDEFGLNMGGITGKSAGAHQQQILQMLMELFTSSNDTFIGSEYSNKDGKSPRIDIEQPCLSIFATTVKHTFFSAMSSKQSLSGFIPRWLMLDDKSNYKLSREDVTTTTPSPELIETVKNMNGINGIYSVKETSDNKNESKLDTPYEINPIMIPFSADAKIYLREFEKEIVNKQNNESKNSEIGQDAYCAIWARAREYAIKLALCGHENGEISLPVMKWGVELVTYCISATIKDIAVSVADNEQEAFTKKLLEIVAKTKKVGLTKGQLTKRSYWVSGYQRENIIKDLEASYQIKGVPVTINNNDTIRYYLYGLAPTESVDQK